MDFENILCHSKKSSFIDQSREEEEPKTKRRKFQSVSTEQVSVITDKSNLIQEVPTQLTMEEYAQLKLELHQRKIFLTVCVLVLVAYMCI